MIELIDLTKRYSSVLAVDSLNLSVGSGEVFACLGPNGAGKTTTIRMMMGLLRPTSGRVRLGGHDLVDDAEAAKAICGFVPDRPHVYEKLTGREFLGFVAGLYQVAPGDAERRADELLEVFDLDGWQGEMIETYSHGMKQRLVMAGALIHRPRILILDEPMVGLDPRGARLLKRTLRALAAQGVTVFLSTHSLEVAEELADRVGIINQGQLIACGTVEELRTQSGGHVSERLESIFLSLTGGEDEREIVDALRN
jgi:ABC-2 type transport system ATP-binding protein